MSKPTITAGALSLALILTLLLLALLLLLCSTLRRRRRHPATIPAAPTSPLKLFPANLSPFYAHGVLRAPTKFLLSSPKLDALILQPAVVAEEDADGRFVCISNPVYDEGVGKVVVEDGERSPELMVMRKLPSKAGDGGCVVAGRWSVGKSGSATETKGTCSSSELLCSSPSF